MPLCCACEPGTVTSVETTPTETAPVGRRERKKLATRRALQQAALRLALERGVERVTVEDICAEADVAQRTFFNHFAGKDDALVGDPPPFPGQEVLDAFVTGSGDMWDDLRVIMLARAPVIVAHREEMLARRRLLEDNPVLLARYLGHFSRFERAVVEAVAARTGTDPAESYPQLVAGVTVTVMRVSLRRWCSAEDGTPLEHHIDETFALLRTGL